MPVLLRVFPQGLDSRDAQQAARLREAYEDWLERGAKQPGVHQAWIRHVLHDLLGYPAGWLAEGQAIPAGLQAVMANVGEVLRPDIVLKHADAGGKPILLVALYPPEQDLEKPISGKLWKATAGTRMMELLHASDLPLGVITNGEEWTLVSAPRGETTGFASWYSDLWMQEPLTLRAFHSLLHLRRLVGVAAPDTLPALLIESSKDQQEVTDQLGYQVRQAVEVLVQAFDRIDAEAGRKLLGGVTEKSLYDSALTVMMRLVFLFSAEERGLLLLGDPLYDQNYAVSTLSALLREQADQHGEEVLERRHDAWCRLLSTFRAVHGGVAHEAMRLPPYGGALFDPDRYRFLEGRSEDTLWRDSEAAPLLVDNRVVLHLLEALQMLRVRVAGSGPTEARRLSFRALDIEQIGHVYEGLLDHTAKRAAEPILGLAGSKDKEPEIPLAAMEELRNRGTAALVEFLRENTGRSDRGLTRAVEEPQTSDEHSLLIACGHDEHLAHRIRPFVTLLREDSFGRVVVIPPGTLYVTSGTDRRSTGTHYTPRSFTEPIVKQTIEPLLYEGPSNGLPASEWTLKTSKEILTLKVCDMAMGSGAFLVETCRYMAERLVEAWENAEREHPGSFVVTPDGELSIGAPTERLIPADSAERVAIARRYVADRCLYGVDINPMAVEMAKLSLWLTTMQKERPFTFLDHCLKCGDSLLGVSSLQQVEYFGLRDGDAQITFAHASMRRQMAEASAKRRALEGLPSNNYTEILDKSRLHREAEVSTLALRALADALIAFDLEASDSAAYDEQRTEAAHEAELALDKPSSALEDFGRHKLGGLPRFHWPIEFPEVFEAGGFDAFVGNPPFKAGRFLSRDLGSKYLKYLQRPPFRLGGQADLCAAFAARAYQLCGKQGLIGLITTKTISEGATREAFLSTALSDGGRLIWVDPLVWWPGNAAVVVSLMVMERTRSGAQPFLRGVQEPEIDSTFSAGSSASKDPHELARSASLVAKGVGLGSDRFVLTATGAEPLRAADPTHVRRYIGGSAHNTSADGWGGAFVFWFQDIDDESSLRRLQAGRVFIGGTNPDDRSGQFWKYRRSAAGMFSLLEGSRFCIVRAQTSSTWTFSFWTKDDVFDQSMIVFGSNCEGLWSLLNSSIHEAWAGKYGRLMKTDTAYAPSSAFNTFPLPYNPSAEINAPLASIARRVSAVRERVEQIRQGKTATYRSVHDPSIKSEDIMELRALQREMDHAVASSYNWADLDLGHGFHQMNQGIRYTISEVARRILLDRLLALNYQLHEEEAKAVPSPKLAKSKSGRRGPANGVGSKPSLLD